MVRILFLLLSVFLASGAGQSYASIEIDADGQRYDSLKDYLTAQQSSSKHPYVSTVVISQKRDSAPVHELRSLSAEYGVAGALKDFHQHQRPFDLHLSTSVSAEQLRNILENEISTSKEPKLLISAPGKVRIMSLAGHEDSQVE